MTKEILNNEELAMQAEQASRNMWQAFEYAVDNSGLSDEKKQEIKDIAGDWLFADRYAYSLEILGHLKDKISRDGTMCKK